MRVGYEDFDLTSYDREERSGNSHLQFRNKPTLFTGPKNFNTYGAYYDTRSDYPNMCGATLGI